MFKCSKNKISGLSPLHQEHVEDHEQIGQALEQNTPASDPADIFGEVIHSYSRVQAIEDGELVDVSEMAREAGFKFPVAVTRALFVGFVEPPEAVAGWQDTVGRLWDVLWMLRLAARKAEGTHVRFHVLFQMTQGRPRKIELLSVCGPGDTAEPVITVGLPEDF